MGIQTIYVLNVECERIHNSIYLFMSLLLAVNNNNNNNTVFALSSN